MTGLRILGETQKDAPPLCGARLSLRFAEGLTGLQLTCALALHHEGDHEVRFRWGTT